MSTIACYRCNVPIDMDDNTEAARREDHETFYCLNGHGQAFWGQSEKDKTIARLERLLRSSRSHVVLLSGELRDERRAHAATKGKLTKARKRLAALRVGEDAL